jgi:hypothetical protein
MEKLTLAKHVKMLLVVCALFFWVSQSIADSSCEALELNVLRAQAMEQANSIASAQSALDALHKGDITVAINTLEAQLRSGLLVLHTLQPQLSAPGALDPQQREIVDEALKDGDTYEREHKLTAKPPKNNS